MADDSILALYCSVTASNRQLARVSRRLTSSNGDQAELQLTCRRCFPAPGAVRPQRTRRTFHGGWQSPGARLPCTGCGNMYRRPLPHSCTRALPPSVETAAGPALVQTHAAGARPPALHPETSGRPNCRGSQWLEFELIRRTLRMPPHAELQHHWQGDSAAILRCHIGRDACCAVLPVVDECKRIAARHAAQHRQPRKPRGE